MNNGIAEEGEKRHIGRMELGNSGIMDSSFLESNPEEDCGIGMSLRLL